jgi:hypothetical protein
MTWIVLVNVILGSLLAAGVCWLTWGALQLTPQAHERDAQIMERRKRPRRRGLGGGRSQRPPASV